MDELLGVVEQIILPGILAYFEFFTLEVLDLGLVDFGYHLLELLAYVLAEVGRLPVVYWTRNEFQTHLRPQILCKFALFAVELDYLVREGINIVFDGFLVDSEHQRAGHLSLLFVQGNHHCHTKFLIILAEISSQIVQNIHDVDWSEWLL